MSSSRPELKHRHSLSPFSEITPSHTPGTWTPKTPIHIATRSFENLVALAKDQELRREAKKLVWRSRGEHPAELDTIEACLDHAWKGGQRAGTLAFGIRAGVNLFLLLFRILRTPRKLKFALVRHAIFGTDTFRFAAMLGSFVAIYKFLINGLPLLPNEKLPSILQYTPPSSHSEFESGTRTPEGPLYMKRKEEKKPASTTEEKPSSRDVFVRKPVARWHSLVAGALAGLAVAFETKGRRLTIAQQMFVRGLQGSYNYWSKQYGIQIPYGSVMVFSLCCGQILYAFLLSPDTIPRSYREWIQRASKVPAAGVSMNFDLVRKGTFKVADIKELIDWERTTPGNRKKLIAELEAATTKGDFGPEFASCAAVHPFFDSCKSVPLDRFLTVSAWMVPIYGALHFIPMLLFKRKEFVKQPLKMLARSAYGTARSSAFLGVFVMIYQTYFCMKHNLYLAPRLKWIPPHLRVALISRASWWLGGLLSGFSLFVEDKRRREELAMYVLPRGLESAWSVMRRRGWVPIVPGGENLLCAFGMAMVMATYQTSPQHLSGLVRRVLYQFIGPN